MQKFSWTSYPFLIDLEMKTKMLEYHNLSEQDVSIILFLCEKLGSVNESVKVDDELY